MAGTDSESVSHFNREASEYAFLAQILGSRALPCQPLVCPECVSRPSMPPLERFDPSEYVKASTAARLLGVSSRTVRNYCRHGVFPGARQWEPGSSHWLIPRTDLAALLSDSSCDADVAEN